MRIWEFCTGENHRCKVEVEPWRVVEAQHISSSRDLVDTVEEHELLEELLEQAKPPITNQEIHYLLFTPFRYPPLKYGSRFGNQYENSLWYGSKELETAFAEVAYYRLKFFDDTSANLEYIDIPVTAFKVYIKTQDGADLTTPPFKEHHDKISNKLSYEYSQPLGSDMREAGIEAFLYTSARTKQGEINVGVYTPKVFIKKNDSHIANMQNWRCIANRKSIEFTRSDLFDKKTWSFYQDEL